MTSWAGVEPDTEGITSIEDAYNVVCTSVTTDSDVGTSLVKFITDGSPVIIAYEAPFWQSESKYIGGRAGKDRRAF